MLWVGWEPSSRLRSGELAELAVLGQCPLSEAERLYACLSLSCGSCLSAGFSLSKLGWASTMTLDLGFIEKVWLCL